MIAFLLIDFGPIIRVNSRYSRATTLSKEHTNRYAKSLPRRLHVQLNLLSIGIAYIDEAFSGVSGRSYESGAHPAALQPDAAIVFRIESRLSTVNATWTDPTSHGLSIEPAFGLRARDIPAALSCVPEP